MSCLYAVLGLMSHGIGLLIPVVIVAVALVGRPLLLLRGRTLLEADRITVRRSPIGRVVVPVSEIGIVETRRGLVLEWPVLCLRDGSLSSWSSIAGSARSATQGRHIGRSCGRSVPSPAGSGTSSRTPVTRRS